MTIEEIKKEKEIELGEKRVRFDNPRKMSLITYESLDSKPIAVDSVRVEKLSLKIPQYLTNSFVGYHIIVVQKKQFK